MEAAKRTYEEDKRLSELQAEKEAELRKIRVQIEAETEELHRLNEEAMRVRKLRELEDNAQRAVLEAELFKDTEDTPTLKPSVTTQVHKPAPTSHLQGLFNTDRDSSQTHQLTAQESVQPVSSVLQYTSTLTQPTTVPAVSHQANTRRKTFYLPLGRKLGNTSANDSSHISCE